MATARTVSRHACRSSILCTSTCRSPGTTATGLAVSRSHIPVHRLPQPAGRPPPSTAVRVRLCEHFAADPTTEAALEKGQPHLFSPELCVSLVLEMPLVDLPGGMPAPRAVRLFLFVPHRCLYPSLLFFRLQHQQAGQH